MGRDEETGLGRTKKRQQEEPGQKDTDATGGHAPAELQD